VKPHRYLVAVWMYDHWGVSFSSDDRDDAIHVYSAAAEKVPAVFTDTRPDDDPIGPDDAPVWMNADEARGYHSGWVQALSVVLAREI